MEEVSVRELGRCIGCGDQAEVFECEQGAVKLYKGHVPECVAKDLAFQEANVLAILQPLDVPAPRLFGITRFEGRWGVVMNRIEGADLRNRPETKVDMARLHLAVHGHQGLPLQPLKARLGDHIRKAAQLDAVQRRALLDRLDRMPDGDRLCHGDFQPSNVMMSSSGNASIVDWLYATRGVPAVDVCQSYLLMRRSDEPRALAYVQAYAEESHLLPNDILNWLPVVAGARLVECGPKEVTTLIAMVDQAL